MYIGHGRLRVCVCLSLAAFLHYCTDQAVTWVNGRRCPLVVHCLADLQSVHGFRCYDVSECLYSVGLWRVVTGGHLQTSRRVFDSSASCPWTHRRRVYVHVNLFTGRRYAIAVYAIHRVIWRHISVVAVRSPFCRSTPSYCAQLSGENLSRYSNKIESVGVRRCPYYRYLTKKVMSE